MPSKKISLHTYHRFLDEAWDTTFFWKWGAELIGQEWSSKAFMLGMVRFKSNIVPIRARIIELQNSVALDPYFKSIPSIQKRINGWGFFFHAKDDIPEVRKLFFDFLRNEIDFSFEAVVGRKIPKLFVSKHNSRDNEFYADLLSHLLKSKLRGDRLILNISERWSSTRSNNLSLALTKAKERFVKKHNWTQEPICEVNFNVQSPTTEPLLSVPDYLLWSVQRIFERGETRYYNYMIDKIPLVVDLYDTEKYEGWLNYYNPTRPLTEANKII